MPDAQPDLVHLAYVSVATRQLNRDELIGILEVARRKNEPLEVTGILLYIDDTFFQVLEGPAQSVEGVFTRISRDNRHNRVLKLIQEPIHERAFPDWSMGYAAVSRKDLEAIPGLRDFLQTKHSLVDMPESRARKLLEAFTDGRWRASVLP